MFVVKKNESINKTIRFPVDLIDSLEKIAAEKDISFSQLVIQCCEYALNHIENEEKQP
jgi:hypothetical protein